MVGEVLNVPQSRARERERERERERGRQRGSVKAASGSCAIFQLFGAALIRRMLTCNVLRV